MICARHPHGPARFSERSYSALGAPDHRLGSPSPGMSPSVSEAGPIDGFLTPGWARRPTQHPGSAGPRDLLNGWNYGGWSASRGLAMRPPLAGPVTAPPP